MEPEHRQRLGASVSLAAHTQDEIDTFRAHMRTLGLRHLRVVLDSETALDGLSWFGSELDILPSVPATGMDMLASLLDRHGHLFRTVELLATAPADVDGLIAAARLAREVGKTVIIGLAGVTKAQIALLGNSGIFSLAGGVSCEFGPGGITGDVFSAARTHNGDLHYLITGVGAEAARHYIDGQAYALLRALHTDATAIYWCALQDDALTDNGLIDVSDNPKPLARLLSTSDGAELYELIRMARRKPSPVGDRPVLITGGAGFIGANLADRLATDGHHVHIFDALARPGVERNLLWLASRHPANISVTLRDLRDERALEDAASNASCVFHLAGQVAVTTSMVRPLDDFEVNARGTLALLDVLRRRNPEASLIFASTNKVYGDLGDIELARDGDRYLPTRADLRAHGVSETRPLCFHTPYGCSKGTADQYVLDYAHSFGLRTAVLRMSCIYGERQFGTEDQGWVAHFLLRAIAGEPVTIYGDGRQVRDVLHVGDAVAAYLAAWRDIDAISGRAYNLGGGPDNAISLLQLIEHIESMLGTRVDVNFAAWRPGDQRYFVADTQAIRRDLRLPPALGWRDGLRRLAAHFGATLQTETHVTEPAL